MVWMVILSSLCLLCFCLSVIRSPWGASHISRASTVPPPHIPHSVQACLLEYYDGMDSVLYHKNTVHGPKRSAANQFKIVLWFYHNTTRIFEIPIKNLLNSDHCQGFSYCYLNWVQGPWNWEN